jgi:membrane-associated protein
MDYIIIFIHGIMHLDESLGLLITAYGAWIYALLFLIIFCETGLVVAPFLPGDSLLFAGGALAALGSLDIKILYLLILAAAIIGDTANYWIGNRFGDWILQKKIIKIKYLNKTHTFFEKYGGKTIVIARFIPLVRTFAPFIAGISRMDYAKFFFYNMLGGTFWATFFIFIGYFFGNLPIVKNNFSLVILLIILLSVIPPLREYLKNKNKK